MKETENSGLVWETIACWNLIQIVAPLFLFNLPRLTNVCLILTTIAIGLLVTIQTIPYCQSSILKLFTIIAAIFWVNLHPPGSAPLGMTPRIAEIVKEPKFWFSQAPLIARFQDLDTENNHGVRSNESLKEGDQVIMFCKHGHQPLFPRPCQARLLSKKGAPAETDFEEVKTQQGLSAWTHAMVWGDLHQLPDSVSELFKDLSLFHILVISGLHFTLLSQAVRRIFLLLPLLFYCAGKMSGCRWQNNRRIVELVSLCFLCIYAIALGFPSPCQRAFLLILIGFFSKNIIYIPHTLRKISFAFFIQTLFFGETIFSLSTALSWGAYLCITEPDHHCRESSAFYTRIKTHFFLGLMGWLFFTRFSMAGWIIGLIFLDLFTVGVVVCYIEQGLSSLNIGIGRDIAEAFWYSLTWLLLKIKSSLPGFLFAHPPAIMILGRPLVASICITVLLWKQYRVYRRR